MSSGTGVLDLPFRSLADIVCIGLAHSDLHSLKKWISGQPMQADRVP
jgi:hypothetical protein